MNITLTSDDLENLIGPTFCMNLPVYVINLDFRLERWEMVAESAALYAPHFDLQRISAIEGKAPEWAGRPGADEKKFANRCGRSMLPGEYGCYYSHLKALETFLAGNAPYGLILEDDVVFDENSATRIQAVLDAMPGFGVIKIVNHRNSMLIELGKTSAGDVIGRTLHGPQGSAAAYLVSREGAQGLLTKIRTMNLPWDVALERFWHHGVSVFSTKSNLLPFSEHSSTSNIASGGGYAGKKFPWYRRLGAAGFRTTDIVRRIRHTLPYPTEKFTGNVPQAPTLPLWAEIFAGIAFLAMVSAVWIETDAYRYVALALTIPALWHYFRSDLWSYHDRPHIGLAGALCLIWGLHVALRFAYDYVFYPERGTGTSEGIYLFTLLYPSMGAAFLLYTRRPFMLATAFMTISLASLLLGINYTFGSTERALTLLHKNPIHASAGAGFIMLCTIPYLLHVLKRPGLAGITRLALGLLAGATFLAALQAAYSLQSNGVWLGLSVALPLTALLIMVTDSGRWGKWIALAAILIAMAGAAANFQMLRNIAEPTIETSVALVEAVFDRGSPRTAIDDLIARPSTPSSERERLMLWATVLDIWERHPVAGAGIGWMHEWKDRHYQETTFNLLHNGYMEIIVRYGMIGLAFYLYLFLWSGRRIWLAARAGLIDMTAFQAWTTVMIFFAVTLLSNSNNRLAIGESFMWVAAGYGFYCHFMLQQRDRRL